MSSPSTWFLAQCRSQETAEKHVSQQPAGGFVIWPSPTLKGCLILSTKHESGSIEHMEIYKRPGGFKIKGHPRFYSSLEMLILSLRKEGKKGEESASQEAAPKKSPRPERREQPTPKSPATPKSPRIQAIQGQAAGSVPADEKVITEMQELFPTTNREKIVRATTLAAGDREKAMDLLLSQSIDSQQAKNQKVESLGKVLKDVIEQSRGSLQALQKLAQGVKDANTLSSPSIQSLQRALSTIKKLMINVPGPSAQSPRPAGPSGTAQLATFQEDVKQVTKVIMTKLLYIDTEIEKKTLSVKKMVEMGGVVKQVREQLASAETACKPLLLKLEDAESKASVGDDKEGADSPAQSSRNYVIPYSELDIEKEIGKGAYGKVYKARYDGREVAVKSMALLKDERERNWMKREISLLKQVRHPNVTEFIGISKDPDNNLLIVMEFVPGGELYPLLQKEDLEIDWPLRLKIAHDVASALAFMHARNIIHRDIKSENLLVDDQWRIKLCDFGFARAIESREKTRMTMCVPEDHEILTSAGFMDLDTWLQARDDPNIKVAGYDADSDSVVFERPVREIVLDHEERRLVELSQKRDMQDTWGPAGGDYGRGNVQHGLSVLVTQDHSVYAQLGGGQEPASKVLASTLLSDSSPAYNRIGQVAVAGNGVKRAGRVKVLPELGFVTADEEAAFLALYGFWMGRGALTEDGDSAVVGPVEDAETQQWMRATMGQAGLMAGEWKETATEWSICRPGWRDGFCDASGMAEWVWQLDKDQLRSLLSGMFRSSGESNLVRTTSARLRDETIRVALLAGFSSSFRTEMAESARPSYCVVVSESRQPVVVSRDEGEVREQLVSGRVWCFTMPCGLFWVRRAHKNAQGVVTKASCPIVTGNCGSPYFNAPELLLGKAYNEKADVFAFGILLCEIITRAAVNLDRLGKKEFNAYALDLDGLRQKVPKDCPGPFWKLSVVCCSYEPEKRPSMNQVEKMLAAIMKCQGQ